MNVGAYAVNVATKGEIKKFFKAVNWKNLGHFIGIWLITLVTLFLIVSIISVANYQSEEPLNMSLFIHNIFKSTDMLNMSFSLVLSALLEHIWSQNNGIFFV